MQVSKNTADIMRDFKTFYTPWLLATILSALLKSKAIKQGDTAGIAGGRDGKLRMSPWLCV